MGWKAFAAALILTPVTAWGQAADTAPVQTGKIAVVTSKLSPTDDPSLTDRPTPRPIVAQKIILVGDSTTQVGSGWGGAFCADHVVSSVACVDLARGGRSTYSYIAEGSWQIALDEMKSGGFAKTYVLIQFGHNDQPGKPGRSTNLATEFPANLKRYVEEARAAGAIPVLVTPITRREFKNGVLQDDLEPWAEAVRKVAEETGTPLCDLHKDSSEAVAAMGAAEAITLAEIAPPPEVLAAAESGTTIGAPKTGMPGPALDRNDAEPVGDVHLVFDYTHLGPKGAALFSAMVTRELAKAVPELDRQLVP